MIAICAKCRWLHDHAKGQSWTRWMCSAAVNDEVNYVSGEVEPYLLARFVNRNGDCPKFEEGFNCLHPKEMAHV